MLLLDLVKVVPIAGITSALTFAGTAWASKLKRRQTEQEQDDRLEIHRDELTFELLQNARAEVAVARNDIDALRRENRSLREIEQRFYHFEQSLDHIEAILIATTPEQKTIAERNARAFLNRMRRLNEAKGTIANEAQLQSSEQELRSRGADIPFNLTAGPENVGED